MKASISGESNILLDLAILIGSHQPWQQQTQFPGQCGPLGNLKREVRRRLNKAAVLEDQIIIKSNRIDAHQNEMTNRTETFMGLS